jgi:hypothetical protein
MFVFSENRDVYCIHTLSEVTEHAVSNVMVNGPVREGVTDGFICQLDS